MWILMLSSSAFVGITSPPVIPCILTIHGRSSAHPCPRWHRSSWLLRQRIGCPECLRIRTPSRAVLRLCQRLESLESLRTSMNLAQLYEKAPAPFRKKVLASLGSARSVAAFPSRTVWSWLAAAAAIFLAAYLGAQLVKSQHASNDGPELAAEIVDAHLRSLQPGHLIDVVSADQHTVSRGSTANWIPLLRSRTLPIRDSRCWAAALMSFRVALSQRWSMPGANISSTFSSDLRKRCCSAFRLRTGLSMDAVA
jgi:hypothetical protein